MYRSRFLCSLSVLLMIHTDAVVKGQMINEHDAYKSAGSHQRNAFYALQSCHQILYGDTGEFFSPDYLCSNPALWCNWTIQVQPGKHVQLYLEDLTPEHMCHLKTDQIHLDESPVSAGERRILERCWRRSLYTSVSSTVHVVQLIRQNPNPPQRGFYGAYQAFGRPKTPDPSEMSAKEQIISEDPEGKDAATQVPRHENLSNELDKNAEDAHTENTGHVVANHSIIPLAVTAESFREMRNIRGEDKNQEAPVHGEFPRDDDESVSLPTGVPHRMNVERYTSAWFDGGPHSAHILASTYTTHTVSPSAGTPLTRSTKKRAHKRKPVLAQSFTTTATMKKNKVTHFSQVASPSSDPTETTMAEPTGSMDVLKTDDDDATLLVGSEQHVDGVDENRPDSKKIKKSHGVKGKSLPVQNFRFATEPPYLTADCSRTSAPTVLYAVCFMLCFLIALLLVVLGVMYRRYHHGAFLPHSRPCSSVTANDINNNLNSGRGSEGSGSKSHRPPAPPPPPPLRTAGGAPDLRLLRFSPLTPPDGFEGKPEKAKEAH